MFSPPVKSNKQRSPCGKLVIVSTNVPFEMKETLCLSACDKDIPMRNDIIQSFSDAQYLTEAQWKCS